MAALAAAERLVAVAPEALHLDQRVTDVLGPEVRAQLASGVAVRALAELRGAPVRSRPVNGSAGRHLEVLARGLDEDSRVRWTAWALDPAPGVPVTETIVTSDGTLWRRIGQDFTTREPLYALQSGAPANLAVPESELGLLDGRAAHDRPAAVVRRPATIVRRPVAAVAAARLGSQSLSSGMAEDGVR